MFIRGCLISSCIPLFVAVLFCVADSLYVSQQDCCIRYSYQEIKVQNIKCYTIQKSDGTCNIDAIIFHTVQHRKICTNPNASKVRKTLKVLTNAKQCQIKKMKKENPDTKS
ncbi:C-C motif chemokine 17-like [Polypterus senegalus]|uniref:C-C motif chemokine 17-like n=1 Tax=Polypterus senegalus TaxID=55291 RepID=UPI0019661E90|nr:C-C motif chemokine 17-like [Polypterus senegalus]